MHIEDQTLVWKFNRGSQAALQRIYEKFKDDLLGLALSLLRDRSLAEDVVHDVFVAFARTAGRFRLSGTLKGYLLTCVANGARDRNRRRASQGLGLDDTSEPEDSGTPLDRAAHQETAEQVQLLLGRLPYEQREIIVLHLHEAMRFREIAQALGLSINTVQSRYRYGLNKLRSLLNDMVIQ